MQQKGFTLIELLIVIAIIAVLSVVVVLTLNPAELLRQARDSTRISDMSSLNSAMSLFLADGGTFGTATTCYAHGSSTATSCAGAAASSMNFSSTTLATVATTSVRNNDSTGWIPVNFNSISAGAPFGILPVDPTNNNIMFYAFATGSSSTYKLNSRMESTKYKWQGTSDVVTNDGEPTIACGGGGLGCVNNTTTYAVGNKMDL
ncbi:MAG: prepilin-type N-terminal cleavage/methylation domain-containing protein [Patescibacteria group bacterium]